MKIKKIEYDPTNGITFHGLEITLFRKTFFADFTNQYERDEFYDKFKNKFILSARKVAASKYPLKNIPTTDPKWRQAMNRQMGFMACIKWLINKEI